MQTVNLRVAQGEKRKDTEERAKDCDISYSMDGVCTFVRINLYGLVQKYNFSLKYVIVRNMWFKRPHEQASYQITKSTISSSH